MKQKSKDGRKDETQRQADGNQQRQANQGDNQGYQGQAGQQSGSTGSQAGGGVAGQDSGSRQSADPLEDDLIGMDESLEVQQSAQREGMGRHRHTSRANEQNLDGTIDIDELGSQRSGPDRSR